MKRLCAGLFLAVTPLTSFAASMKIVSPGPDMTVSGFVKLRVEITPAEAAGRVTSVAYTVDGRTACRVEQPPWECQWNAGPSIMARQVRAVATLQGGERLVAARRTRTVDLTLAVEVELVQVTATVTDRKGQLVRGLLPRDFRVFEDGRPQQVSHFVGADEPREIVIAVDMSGSMLEAMPKVRDAVRGFLAALRPDDRVTLLAFNDSIFTLARPDADAATRARALERLAAWGGTALHDVILKGYDALDRIKGRKALVVFSDGDDESSRATVAEVERRAERSDSPVYMIGQGRGTKEANLRRILDHLATMSGGRAFYTDEPEQLKEVFATIVEELQSQYVLAYASTRTELDDAWHTIKVEAGEGHIVRARQGYRAGRRP